MPTVDQRAPDRPTRRSFHVAAIYAICGAIATALGVPAAIYLFFPPKLRRQSQWDEAGDIASLAPDSPVEMLFRRNRVDGWKVLSQEDAAWVVKWPDGRVVAFGPQCTHLGCAYHWDESKNEFICPCHSSVFSIHGKVLSGPAPRPLDRYQVRVEGSKLLLGRLLRPSGGNA